MESKEHRVVTSHISNTHRNTVVLNDTITIENGRFFGSHHFRIVIQKKTRAKKGYWLGLLYSYRTWVFRGDTKDSVLDKIAEFVAEKSLPYDDIMTVARKALA